MKKLNIVHVNLARGFRGGERQTISLMKALQAYTDPEIEYQQSLIARHTSPMFENLINYGQIKLSPIHKPYWIKAVQNNFKQPTLLQAHDAKSAQWCWLQNRFFKTPYCITRRIISLPKLNQVNKSIYRNAAAIISVSSAIHASVQMLLAKGNLTSKASNLIIPDMCSNLRVDHTISTALKNLWQGKTVIGHVGALVDSDKGQSFIIEAARYFSDKKNNYHFVFVGSGKDQQALQTQAKALSNVEFCGFQSEVGSYLNAFDLFIFPSLREGFGSSLLDAMQARLPIIASQVGGIPDLITHEKNGILIEPKSSESIIRAIEKVVSQPAETAKLVSQATLDLKNYQSGQIAKCYSDLYKNIEASFFTKRKY